MIARFFPLEYIFNLNVHFFSFLFELAVVATRQQLACDQLDENTPSQKDLSLVETRIFILEFFFLSLYFIK